jgi:hypothetical protein
MEGGPIIFMIITSLVVLALVALVAEESRCPTCKVWFAKRTVDRSYDRLLYTDVVTIRCTRCHHQWNELRETKKQLILGFVSELFAGFFR